MEIVAADIMTRSVVTVTEQTSLEEAARLLDAHRITGLPVVDAEGRLTGILSQSDLVRRTRWIGAWSPDLVGQVMSRAPVTVPPSEPLPSLCQRMVEHRIHRVVVVEGETIRGVLTTLDILAVVAAGGIPQELATPLARLDEADLVCR